LPLTAPHTPAYDPAVRSRALVAASGLVASAALCFGACLLPGYNKVGAGDGGGADGPGVDAPADDGPGDDVAVANDASEGGGEGGVTDAGPPDVACSALALRGGSATAPPIAAYDPSGSFTVEAWVKPTALQTANGRENIVGHWNEISSGTGSYALFLFIQQNEAGPPSDFLSFVVSCTGSDFPSFASSSSVEVDKWTHVAATVDSAAHTAYVWLDGVQLGSGPVDCGAPHAIDAGFELGYDDTQGGAPFLGYIREVRLSGGVRYTNTFTPADTFDADTNTVALFHLAGTPDDSSQHHNAVTIKGDASFVTSCP